MVSIYDKMTNSERQVADLLKELGIFWQYEKPVYIKDDCNRPRVWTPDFFLTPFGIYVEVCGSKDFNYEYRRKILDKNGIKVIFLHLYKDKDKWEKHFFGYLKFFISLDYKYLDKILNRYN